MSCRWVSLSLVNPHAGEIIWPCQVWLEPFVFKLHINMGEIYSTFLPAESTHWEPLKFDCPPQVPGQSGIEEGLLLEKFFSSLGSHREQRGDRDRSDTYLLASPLSQIVSYSSKVLPPMITLCAKPWRPMKASIKSHLFQEVCFCCPNEGHAFSQYSVLGVSQFIYLYPSFWRLLSSRLTTPVSVG